MGTTKISNIVSLMDQAACRAYLIDRVHPDGPACPACFHVPEGRSAKTWRNGGRVKCYLCGKFYTAWSGTVFSGTHMDPRQLVLLFFLADIGAALDVWGDVVSVSKDTVWLWNKKIELMGK